MKKSFKNTFVATNPLVEHNLAIVRDKNTDSVSFRNAFFILSMSVILEGIKNIPLKKKEIETPICKTTVNVIDTNYNFIVVPILRAGLAIADKLISVLPDCSIQHLGMRRDEKTKKPIWYLDKTPKEIKNPSKTIVFLCDPMLATAGSATVSIKKYVVEKKIPEENVIFLSTVSAPEGLERIYKEFPKVKIYTNVIDEKLNENKFIVPGLGDAGDRYFNA